jgi:hypothetical protein
MRVGARPCATTQQRAFKRVSKVFLNAGYAAFESYVLERLAFCGGDFHVTE